MRKMNRRPLGNDMLIDINSIIRFREFIQFPFIDGAFTDDGIRLRGTHKPTPKGVPEPFMPKEKKK